MPVTTTRRLAAIYFADIVGYSRLSSEDEPAALRLVERLQRLGRGLVGEHGGRVVKFVGDALLAEFPSSEAAVRSALSLAQSFSADAGAADARLRVGVHVGELTIAPDGDIYGDGVNIASRLQAEAAPGHVLVSEDVWRQLRRVPVFEFQPLGERTLKGLPEPVATYEVALSATAAASAAPTLAGAAAHTAATSTEDTSRTRLIVLPFRVLRADADIDFLAFGLPDAITCSLSGLQSLTVRSSVAALRFATETPDLRAIAAETDVDMILTGTLLRVGEQVRVSAQLTDVSHGTVRWSETLQVMLRDLFQLQDELTKRIVDSLATPLTARDRTVLSRDVPTSARAFELYLRANQLALESNEWATGRDLYEAALAEDPQYAPAWARLGRCYRLIGKYSTTLDGIHDNIARAEQAFQRALALNPQLSLAHNLYAQLEVDLGRPQHAMLRLLERARQTAEDVEILTGLVHACRYCGLFQVSAAAHEQAKRLDPQVRTSAEYTFFMMGDYQRALAEANARGPGYLPECALAVLGRPREALASLRAREPTGPAGALKELYLALRHGLEGSLSAELAAQFHATEIFPDPEGVFFFARMLAYGGLSDLALHHLERAVTKGYYCAFTLRHDPWLDSIRTMSRFPEILKHAETGMQQAAAAFRAAGGEAILGITAA